MDTEVQIAIQAETPIALSSGHADVTLDADILHDKHGLPYFPAKRFKGILYESALEVVEMAACCQDPFLLPITVEELFGSVPNCPVHMSIHDFYLPDYEEMSREWEYLQHQYPKILRPADVLDSYTSIRYQTAIDGTTGVAADMSLHNMRVADAGCVFEGSLILICAKMQHLQALALALRNINYAGLKRNRGCGKISCTMTGHDIDMDSLITSALAKQVNK
jgi:CRISPR-associated protein Csx10